VLALIEKQRWWGLRAKPRDGGESVYVYCVTISEVGVRWLVTLEKRAASRRGVGSSRKFRYGRLSFVGDLVSGLV
jgi:hypothetical protein